jgi:phosphoribosyl-AMP cyclohydrolase
MDLDFSKLDGLITAVVQDHATNEILMVGYMNDEAYRMTEASGVVTFFSRSRNKLWTKGETSGHKLLVHEIWVDCDQDAVVVRVEALGPGVCHTGFRSCFYRRVERGAWITVGEPAYDPNAVYGAKP